MATSLPETIAEYFRASNAHDTAAMLACFDDNATVHDENQDFRGSSAIKDWIVTTTEKYQAIVDITRIDERDGATIVTGQVSGNFPGSPIELQFHFVLQNDKIINFTS